MSIFSKLRSKMQSQQAKQKAVDAQAKSTLDLIGFKSCAKDGILAKTDGTFARYLRIGSTDLFNIDMDGLIAWINAFAVSERVYTRDHKLVAVTARVDTSANQVYWAGQVQTQRSLQEDRSEFSKADQLRLERQDKMRLQRAREQQNNCSAIEQDTKDYVERIYAIQIFGKTEKQLKQRTRDMILSNGNIYGMRTMNKKETEELQERLYNMNSR